MENETQYNETQHKTHSYKMTRMELHSPMMINRAKPLQSTPMNLSTVGFISLLGIANDCQKGGRIHSCRFVWGRGS